MKISLNLYNPNFKAISLNEDEKKQVSSTLRTLQNEDMPEFRKNLLKCDVMDVFSPHIEREAFSRINYKKARIDLNMKMFDALNSFMDKKDPLGWVLSVLNGTEYKPPKPTLLELSDEEVDAIRETINTGKVNVLIFRNEDGTVARLGGKKYFDFDKENKNQYTSYDVKKRARSLYKCFGQQYSVREMVNIVANNKYLIDYDNEYFDKYINDFAEAFDVKPSEIKNCIASHPQILRKDFEEIKYKAEEFAKATGCRTGYCKYALLRKPTLIDENPYRYKTNGDALNFYKAVRDKSRIRPEDYFKAPAASISYFKTLVFLIVNNDKLPVKMAEMNEKSSIINHLKEQDEDKVYHLMLPENKATEAFINYAQKLSEKELGRNIFEFNIVNVDTYRHQNLPRSFKSFSN